MFSSGMVEWTLSKEPVSYPEAIEAMESRVSAIHAGTAAEQVWLLEHPPLYTAGTSAREGDLLDMRFPVHRTGRGGQYTYHGPGQRVAYVMLDLKKRQAAPDIKDYVWRLEEWIIRTLAVFGIAGRRIGGRVGIWVSGPSSETLRGISTSPEGEAKILGEKKIAAIGVRVRHWVTYHGISVNVDPDLSHFDGIVPCGIGDAGVTSIRDVLGRKVSMDELDEALRLAWGGVFESATL